MPITCAIIVRGQFDEIPYLNEFISHHLALGFNHIYYINTDEKKNYLYKYLCPDFLNYVSVFDYSSKLNNWQEECLNEHIHHVKEDWVLNIDMDEFLYLSNGSIQEFLNELPGKVSKIHFPWLMCLSTSYYHSSLFEICKNNVYKSRSFKTLAITKRIAYCELHNIITTDDAEYIHINSYDKVFIIHFACRGFFDLINRIIGRNYQNEKSGSDEEEKLKVFLTEKDTPVYQYPFRIHLYRVELSFPKAPVYFEKISNEYLFQTNTQLLESIFIEKLKRIGIHIPIDERNHLEDYCDKKFFLKARILKNLPTLDFSKSHFEDLKSYVTITKEYISQIEKV